VVCAEGYLFECERRGYLQAGAFVPEVVLEHPEVVRQLHREFVHAGSDVVLAFTYYAHREKLRMIGRAELLEPVNRRALEIAGEVAAESGALLAGGLSNTNLYEDPDSRSLVRPMFEEQARWAAEAGVDLMVAETFSHLGEAMIALEVLREAGLPAVVTLIVHRAEMTRDGVTPEAACRRLEEAGADVVGLNCGRGPWTMLPMLERVREAVRGPVAALPVPYRTTPGQPTFHSLVDPVRPEGPFPTALDPFVCTRYEIADFAGRARALGIEYLGLCCGAGPHHVRSLAEALGRTPPASRYSPDMSKHAFMGTDRSLVASNQKFAPEL
jgi:betaine-homocysteine S-methyltransferase